MKIRKINSGAPRAKRAQSGAPWVRKFGYDVAYARVHLEKEQTPGSRLKHKYAYAYLTHDFQRHFTLNTSLREWKLLSLCVFHRIIFTLLIVSSPSRNFYRCTGCFQSNKNIACRNTQNAARKYHSLLKITHNKTTYIHLPTLTPDWKMWVVAVLLDTISKNMLTQTHVRNENHV